MAARCAVFVDEAPAGREAMMEEKDVIRMMVATMHNADRVPSRRFALWC
jgi:hypothetical protein